MRGSHIEGEDRIGYFGIIPAHAGLTLAARVLRPEPRDHPRACGAHLKRILDWPNPLGSSPRMRGSQELCRILILSQRIIPAHAGLTVTRAASGHG